MSENDVFTQDIAAVARIDAVPIILDMVKHVTGMRFAAVARVTDTHWVALAVDDAIDFGLKPGGELLLESTICHEIRQNRQPVVFTHASEHPVYAHHHTPKTYRLESYASIPIVKANGEFFGTLCAIDTVPAHFDEGAVLKTLGLFAQLIAMHLDLRGDLERSENALADATQTGRLREQFIAVLGHDLRTPLSAIRMSADLLESRLEDKRERGLASAIRKSSQRMGALVEDVLDFARGRLGGGIPVRRTRVDDLQGVFSSVIAEVQASEPDAQIEQDFSIPSGVYCDPTRIGQLLSNLVGNAVTHGTRESPVRIVAKTEGDEVVLSVTNHGACIPDALVPLLFQPFKRSDGGQRGEGLGLGLYIASQIIEGHGGTLSVSSSPDQGTCFVARFPAHR
ncbi:GAF domain-containing protein [Pseudomonas sp. NFACC02]|uniref:GAF domain-containing sensor histidine kinase n=1 Tax=Pseudomonas TaxID=286 RepID=UPI0007851425|nr:MULTISPECIES: GAF domain-containing sensor histidine kinase [Pseudomonas]SEP95913.1 GAF domain-containing protein [Pseudomonas sp. NFACC02]